MQKVDAEIQVNCPIEGNWVSMAYCETCTFHRDTSFKHGNVFDTTGTVDCTADEDEEQAEMDSDEESKGE